MYDFLVSDLPGRMRPFSTYRVSDLVQKYARDRILVSDVQVRTALALLRIKGIVDRVSADRWERCDECA